MKRHIDSEAGAGFALIVAAVTLVIAVLSGIFVLYEPGLTSNAQIARAVPIVDAAIPND